VWGMEILLLHERLSSFAILLANSLFGGAVEARSAFGL